MKHSYDEIYYSEIYDIPIEMITPNPVATRVYFDSIKMKELVETIKKYGIIQPITVRQTGDVYELISGERRVRAAIQAGLDVVPAIIVEAGDEKSAVMTLLENLQREDLCFFEVAESYKNLLKMQNLTHQELAGTIGISRSSVSNKLRLLRLPAKVRKCVRDYGLSERHARALLALPDEQMQISVVKRIHKEQLSAQESEALVERLLTSKEQTSSVSKINITDIKVFSNTMNRAIDIMKKNGVDANMSSENHEWGSRFVIDLRRDEK